MRALALLAVLTGCRDLLDIDDASLTDAPPRPPQQDGAPGVPRVRDGLVAAWTFDEPAGIDYVDTSGAQPPVRLSATSSAVAREPGAIVVAAPATITSFGADRLNLVASDKGEVTLEVWVRPEGAQGDLASPAHVAGLVDKETRNISIEQAGASWVGTARTTQALDGLPALVGPGAQPAVTHLAVVASFAERKLYVNGALAASDPQPAPTFGWTTDATMNLANVPLENRPWLGRYFLVAVYAKALTAAEIQRNFTAGPNAAP